MKNSGLQQDLECSKPSDTEGKGEPGPCDTWVLPAAWRPGGSERALPPAVLSAAARWRWAPDSAGRRVPGRRARSWVLTFRTRSKCVKQPVPREPAGTPSSATAPGAWWALREGNLTRTRSRTSESLCDPHECLLLIEFNKT